MRGSYGLVLVVFGALVILAKAIYPGFVPSDWLPAIGLVTTFGVAWAVTAVVIRVSR